MKNRQQERIESLPDKPPGAVGNGVVGGEVVGSEVVSSAVV